MQLAGRFDDFEGFGSDFNPKIAARWEPVEWLALRANYATSFRAPSLAQSGAGVLLSSYRVDCEATPGACDGDAAADGEALLSEDVGNPNLGAENARSFGGGIVLTPNRDIEFRVDYWNIRHENLVGIDEDDFIRRALAGEFAVAEPGGLPTGTPGSGIERWLCDRRSFPDYQSGLPENGRDRHRLHPLSRRWPRRTVHFHC